MKAAVIGSTGYTGLVLLRILAVHPDVQSIYPVSSSQTGKDLAEVDPGLADVLNKKSAVCNGAFCSIKDALEAGPDVVFGALPHLESASILKPFTSLCPIIDLSADCRLPDPALFRQYYNAEIPETELAAKAAYGLSEWYRDEITSAEIIANPGCFPTAALLPLLPLVSEDLLEEDLVITALTGVSGGGKKAKTELLFSECTENMTAYSPGNSHRHVAEIRSQIEHFTGRSFQLSFTPHLVPLRQGMLCTIAAKARTEISEKQIQECLHSAYGESPFIRLLRGKLPESRWVRWSNRCDIAYHIEGRKVLLFSAIDNLLKGASGQAVQNMNIRFGLEETRGLRLLGEF